VVYAYWQRSAASTALWRRAGSESTPSSRPYLGLRRLDADHVSRSING